MVLGYTPRGVSMWYPGTISSFDLMHSSMHQALGASAAYPLANLALFVPFSIAVPTIIYSAFVVTGTLTTNNAVAIAVYDAAGSLFSGGNIAGPTTVTTASDTVTLDGTDKTLEPGHYFMAFVCDGTRNFVASALAAGLWQSMGVCEQQNVSSGNFPSTATLVGTTRAYVPLFGLNVRSTAL